MKGRNLVGEMKKRWRHTPSFFGTFALAVWAPRERDPVVLALEPQLSRDIVAAASRALGPATDGAPPSFVPLTNAEIRRYARRLVEPQHPDLAVLSYEELAPEAQIRPLGRISIG